MVEVPLIHQALRFELGIDICCIDHLQRNTYLATSSDGMRYVCKLHLKTNRIRAVSFCLNSIHKSPSQPSFAIPNLLLNSLAGDIPLLVFNYLDGDSLGSDSVSDLYPYFCSLALELESIDVQMDSPNTVTFFHELQDEIFNSLAHDNFLSNFLPLIESLPSSQRLCFSHGDFSFQNILSVAKPLEYDFALIDWEYCGLCYEGFDFAWLSTLAHHTGAITLDLIPEPSANHLYFMYLGYLRLIYRLRSVRNRTELHLLHELKVLKDFKQFLDYYSFDQLRYFEC